MADRIYSKEHADILMDKSLVNQIAGPNTALFDKISLFDYGAIHEDSTDEIFILCLSGRIEEEVEEYTEEAVMAEVDFGTEAFKIYKLDDDKYFMFIARKFPHAAVTVKLALTYMDMRNEALGDPPDPTYE